MQNPLMRSRLIAMLGQPAGADQGAPMRQGGTGPQQLARHLMPPGAAMMPPGAPPMQPPGPPGMPGQPPDMPPGPPRFLPPMPPPTQGAMSRPQPYQPPQPGSARRRE